VTRDQRRNAWLQEQRDRGLTVASETEVNALQDEIDLIAIAWRRGRFKSAEEIRAYSTLYNLLQAKRSKTVSMLDFDRLEREGKYRQPANVVTLAELQRQAADRKAGRK
jgi:hypothetical protein